MAMVIVTIFIAAIMFLLIFSIIIRQHPSTSRLVNQNSTSSDGKVRKLQLGWKARLEALFHIIRVPLWSQLRLSIHFYNEEVLKFFRDKLKNTRNPLLELVLSDLSSVTSLHVCAEETNANILSVQSKCNLCHHVMNATDAYLHCNGCEHVTHFTCAARQTINEGTVVTPPNYICTHCGRSHVWSDLVSQHMLRKVVSSTSLEENCTEEEAEEEAEDNDDFLEIQSSQELFSAVED